MGSKVPQKNPNPGRKPKHVPGPPPPKKMGRPTRLKGSTSTTHVLCRCTEEEREGWAYACKVQGKTMTDVMRDALNRELKRAKAKAGKKRRNP